MEGWSEAAARVRPLIPRPKLAGSPLPAITLDHTAEQQRRCVTLGGLPGEVGCSLEGWAAD